MDVLNQTNPAPMPLAPLRTSLGSGQRWGRALWWGLWFGCTWILSAESVPKTVQPEEAHLQSILMPSSLMRLILARETIDQYQNHYHRVSGDFPIPTRAIRWRQNHRGAPSLRVLEPEEAMLNDLADAWDQWNPYPLRTWMAPLENVPVVDPPSPSPPDHPAIGTLRERIAEHLVADGLIRTLLLCLETYGAASAEADPGAALSALEQAGFPVDVLHAFAHPNAELQESTDKVVMMARWVNKAGSDMDVEDLYRHVELNFSPEPSGFRLRPEDATVPLDMLRLQLGGGYEKGVVVGGNLDVIHHLANALPEIRLLIHTPQPLLDNFERFLLSREQTNGRPRITLVAEPMVLTGWAQDNGKAGWTARPNGSSFHEATLVPRYASMGEDTAALLPGDTWLRHSLSQAGHSVVQSSLHFQGGNLMAVTHPITGGRLLLVGETELYRNLSLGLSRQQVVQWLKTEMDVDDVLFLPAVSHHIDLDVSVRRQGSASVALVNDLELGVEQILRHGSAQLIRSGHLDGIVAERLGRLVEAGPASSLARELHEVFSHYRTADSGFDETICRALAPTPADYGPANLQAMLTAIDFAYAMNADLFDSESDGYRRRCLEAIQVIVNRNRRLKSDLATAGFRLVGLPGLPDNSKSFNYINGIQAPDFFIMPVIEGLFAPVDTLAVQQLRQALGNGVHIIPIPAADTMRLHGGIHCLAAAYSTRIPN